MKRAFIAAVIMFPVWHSTAGSSAWSRPDEPQAKGPAELQGTWKLMSLETDGKSHDPVGGGQPRWVIKGEKVLYGGDEIVRLTADASTTPKVIDLKFRDPERVYEGIYTVEKDTLKVCINMRADTKDRPSQLATKDQADWRLLVFEREKAAPLEATEGLTGFVGLSLRNDEENKAVVVNSPLKDSPADKAGFKKDDIILKVGATAATDLQTTINAVRQAKPGSKLEIRIKREDKESTIEVKVGVLPFHYVAGLE